MPISRQAGFIGDMFSWKRTGLAEVGEKAKSKGGRSLGCQRPGGQSKSFVLRAYIVGGMGVKKLHVD